MTCCISVRERKPLTPIIAAFEITDVLVFAGIIVNGRVVANDVTNNSHPDKGHVKTYFGQIAVRRRGTLVKITPSKISVGSDVYHWRDNNTIVTGDLKVKVRRRKNVIIDMGMDVVFMVMRHKRQEPHPGKVDFLGFYIRTGKGLSHSAHGLLGMLMISLLVP